MERGSGARGVAALGRFARCEAGAAPRLHSGRGIAESPSRPRAACAQAVAVGLGQDTEVGGGKEKLLWLCLGGAAVGDAQCLGESLRGYSMGLHSSEKLRFLGRTC